MNFRSIPREWDKLERKRQHAKSEFKVTNRKLSTASHGNDFLKVKALKNKLERLRWDIIRIDRILGTNEDIQSREAER